MAALLSTLDAYPRLSTIADVVMHAEDIGYVIQDRQRLEALRTGRDLGLVEENENVLTETGVIMSRLELSKPDIFSDIMHALYYTLWHPEQPKANCFSWSYQTLCRLLWRGEFSVLQDRRQVASTIEAIGRDRFPGSNIAFSPKSVGGILLWLGELNPPVLQGDELRFTPRTFCPPELFVLATAFVYKKHEADYGTNLLLTEERRDAICEVCLLDPASFNRVSDYAVSQFDYLTKGIGGGWGQYLTLARRPQLKDFAT